MRIALGILAILALGSCTMDDAGARELTKEQSQANRMYLSQKARQSARRATERMNRSRQQFRRQAFSHPYNLGQSYYYRYHYRYGWRVR